MRSRGRLENADALVLTTDPDREGEAIAWQVVHWLEARDAIGDRAVPRAAFQEVTEAAVQAALADPRDLDIDLMRAWQARRALDYLVGYGLSPLLWRKPVGLPLGGPGAVSGAPPDLQEGGRMARSAFHAGAAAAAGRVFAALPDPRSAAGKGRSPPAPGVGGRSAAVLDLPPLAPASGVSGGTPGGPELRSARGSPRCRRSWAGVDRSRWGGAQPAALDRVAVARAVRPIPADGGPAAQQGGRATEGIVLRTVD